MSSKQVQTRQTQTEQAHQESDSDVDDVCSISYNVALESIENLHLFRLEHPHLNSQKGEKLEAVLYQEKRTRDIETLQGIARRALGHNINLQSRDFLGLAGH